MAKVDAHEYQVFYDILLFLKKESEEHPELSDSLDLAIELLQDHLRIYPNYDAATLNRDIISLADAVISEAENATETVSAYAAISKPENVTKTVSADAAISKPENLTDTVSDNTQMEDEAEKYNSEGNKLSSAKLYKEALHQYSCAINLCPEDPVYYHNRATTLYFLERYAECADDCLQALGLDDCYAKVYSRLGMASYQLNNLTLALDMLERAANLEPANNAYKVQIKLVHKKLNQQASTKPDEPDDYAADADWEDVEVDYDPENIQESQAHGDDQTDPAQIESESSFYADADDYMDTENIQELEIGRVHGDDQTYSGQVQSQSPIQAESAHGDDQTAPAQVESESSLYADAEDYIDAENIQELEVGIVHGDDQTYSGQVQSQSPLYVAPDDYNDSDENKENEY